MSLYKRKYGNTFIYWISLTVNGKRVQKSTGTSDRREAQRQHAEIEKELRDQATRNRPDPLWEEVAALWVTERADTSSYEDYMIRLAWLQPHLEGMRLSSITTEVIERIKTARRNTRHKYNRAKDGKTSNSTVNAYLAVISGVLHLAYDHGWLERLPKIRMLREPSRRVRWITQTEVVALCRYLPEYMADMVMFTVATGLRKMNVVKLRWDQVDMQNRVAWFAGSETKNREPLAVPLNDDAVAIIRRRLLHQHPVFVFTFEGREIPNVSNITFRKALEKAGIPDFRWHDLRHTWASWHLQAGTNALELQEMGGWKTTAMLRRYAHLSPARMQDAANRIATIPLRSKIKDRKING